MLTQSACSTGPPLTEAATARPDSEKRITVITGHYGSGKTEFALQYVSALAESGEKTALVDLDIANPYFRSRERQAYMEERGVAVYSNTYNLDITADLPAVAASIRAPLEDPLIRTIVDAGGDDSGARVLIQFGKYFSGPESEILCVVNANRPETSTFEGALSHIRRIESELGLSVSGLICNTHMLRETSADDIINGITLSLALGDSLGIPLRFTLCPWELISEVTGRLTAAAAGNNNRELQEGVSSLFPFRRLLMRESWLDAVVDNTGGISNGSL